MEKQIYLSPPHLSGEEIDFVGSALDSNWVAPVGPYLDMFEALICNRTGAQYCLALNSGTSALHIALLAIGIKAGDIVIISTFTFPASAYPIIYAGAVPFFVDVEADTWNMDPDLLREAIKTCIRQNKMPKAILLPHIYGMPAKLSQILSIADEFGIVIIEDAAEALGSTYFQKQVGLFGKAGVLSFNGNKIITTSGGGAIISDDAELISLAKFLATQARDQAIHYEHSQIGYNYRLSNICAAIGCAQMQVLEDRITSRRQNFAFYKNVLAQTDGILFTEEPDDFFSNRWLTTILTDVEKFKAKTTGVLRENLEKLRIESRPLWKPLHLQPVFKNYQRIVTGRSQSLFENGLCLPSGSGLLPADLEKIAGQIKKVLNLQHI